MRIHLPSHVVDEGIIRLRKAINENMTINDEVARLSSYVGLDILKEIPKTKMTRDENNNPIKMGNFTTELDGINITVNWTARFYWSKNLSKIQNNTAKCNPANRSITVFVFVVDNKIDKGSLFESIQHEISHLFEIGRRGKPYRKQGSYDRAYKYLINQENKNYNSIAYMVNAVLYISFTFEQRAYANGAYAKLMNSDDYGNGFENAIKHTKLFDYLLALYYYYPILKTIPSSNNQLATELNGHGLDRRKFLRITRVAIIRIEEIISRIMEKAKKDYKAKHNLMEFAPSNFEFPLLEETIKKREEKRLSVIKQRLKLVKYLTIDE